MAIEPLQEATGFWGAHGGAIETLAVHGVAILAYALLVNVFYQVISRRVMFGGRRVGGRLRVQGPLHGFLFLLSFPLVSFAYFLLLSMALLFMGGDGQTPALTITLAMAVVLAVRVAAYINEATSHDVAKMLPLGLLGVMLVRADTADLAASFGRLTGLADEAMLIAIYFGVVVVVEYILRASWLIADLFRRHAREAEVPPPPGQMPKRRVP